MSTTVQRAPYGMTIGDKIISKTYKQSINQTETTVYEKRPTDIKIQKEELQFSATILFLLLSLKRNEISRCHVYTHHNY